MLVPSGMRFTFAILAVILSYIWFFQPRWPSSLVGVPVVAVLVLGVWKAALTGEWGVKVNALIPGFRATAIFTAPIVALIVAAGGAVGTLHERPDFLANLLVLIVWGGGQQWILQTVFLREAQRATSRRAGILVAAVLFASLHLPNPFLTTMTLVGAVGWCTIYDRYPNIIPLALSHAIATLAILYAFDDAITGRLRVGVAYLAR
jgi:membrane protease YdiL (CAAX protease family)